MKKKKEIIGQEDTSNLEVDNLKGQVARALADYDNLQKRVAREREEGKYLSRLIIISRFLPVFDMFEDALKHTNDAGLGIAMKVLADTLKDEGVIEILVKVGDTFDPELHEAIDTVSAEESENNKIAEIALKGYKFIEGPVIRHAKVKVFKKQ